MVRKIAAVIPTFNRAVDVIECLTALSVQQSISVQAIVVNDGSSDGTTEKILAQYPQTIVIEGDGNLWWSGCTNVGVQRALDDGFDYVLLLNDDNAMEPGAVMHLLAYAESHPSTLVGSLVLIKGTNLVAYAGCTVRWLKGGPGLKDYRQPYTNQYSHVISADYLGGQGVLINTDVFRKIGLFDAVKFPQYYGDADFYLRARRAGYEVVVEPKSIVWDGINPDGFPRYGFRRGFRKLLNAYTSRRSAVNVVDTTRFYIKHCPKVLIPFGLARRFLGYGRAYLMAQFTSGEA